MYILSKKHTYLKTSEKLKTVAEGESFYISNVFFSDWIFFRQTGVIHCTNWHWFYDSLRHLL